MRWLRWDEVVVTCSSVREEKNRERRKREEEGKERRERARERPRLVPRFLPTELRSSRCSPNAMLYEIPAGFHAGVATEHKFLSLQQQTLPKKMYIYTSYRSIYVLRSICWAPDSWTSEFLKKKNAVAHHSCILRYYTKTLLCCCWTRFILRRGAFEKWSASLSAV